ncbi:MAG: hypothetical protein Q8M03_09480 [Legionella sp.]|nr:hypothetical protein [Legionella sp.]
MENLHDKDINKLKELLRHTGEFIAYFELAESKMIAWRQDIERQSQLQEQKIAQQLQTLHSELDALQEVLTEGGLARYKRHSEEVLKQNQAHVATIQKTGQQLLGDINVQYSEFKQTMTKNLAQIEDYTEQALLRIENQLTKYDIGDFHRIACESCEQVEKVALNTIHKSSGLLRNFQWRSIALALITTLIASFAIGLYINNEMPWEIHKQVMNEREAGRALIKAWPDLSEQEQHKIITNHPRHSS